jgi:hypothetical protein
LPTDRIVETGSKNGSFKKIEDLRNLAGLRLRVLISAQEVFGSRRVQTSAGWI